MVPRLFYIYLYQLFFLLVNINCSNTKKSMHNLEKFKISFINKKEDLYSYFKKGTGKVNKEKYVKILTYKGEISYLVKDKIGYIKLGFDYYPAEIERGIEVLDDFIKLPLEQQKKYSYLSDFDNEKKHLSLTLTLPTKDIKITPPPLFNNMFKIFIIIGIITILLCKIIDFVFYIKT